MSNDTVQVLVIELSETKLVMKSKDSETPIFRSQLSALGFKEYLESQEGSSWFGKGRFKVELISETAVIIEHESAGNGNDDIGQMFDRINESVRTPHVQAVVEGIYTYEQMFLFENMWGIGDRLEYTFL